MSKTKFKTGDWCFHDYELSQIKEMKDGRITSVSTGHINCGGYDLSDTCFPLTLKNKRASDSTEYWRKKIGEIRLNLNMPDINRKLVEIWAMMCEEPEDSKENLQALYDRLQKFSKDIIEKATSFGHDSVEGVQLMRS